MSILSEIFCWWGGNTWSNRLYTRFRGRHVSTDAAGNMYYVQTKGVGPLGTPRRWVIYKDGAEASAIPPEWHGWMHHTTDVLPTDAGYAAKPWEKPHLPNQTGTPSAYRPSGSILGSGTRPKATGDYSAWSPDKSAQR